MKNILSINKLLILALMLIVWSCDKEDYKQEFSSTYPISGDWTIRVNDGTTVSGPLFMKIYNTSFSKDSVWIDDNSTYWQTKSKVKVDMTNLTFSGENTQNEYYDSQVSYANGKVIGKDSIYFEVKFSDDDKNLTYIYAGHRKQSYEEYNTH
ncbi:MAG TPA: lipid-binding protein [Prolixibacteraceae bacterium]|nr:lipid-binding protein [Prolixibacteraceae bacterium]